MPNRKPAPRDPKSLSPRQRQVLRLADERLTNDEIAAELSMRKSTVRAHLREARKRKVVPPQPRRRSTGIEAGLSDAPVPLSHREAQPLRALLASPRFEEAALLAEIDPRALRKALRQVLARSSGGAPPAEPT